MQEHSIVVEPKKRGRRPGKAANVRCSEGGEFLLPATRRADTALEGSQLRKRRAAPQVTSEKIVQRDSQPEQPVQTASDTALGEGLSDLGLVVSRRQSAREIALLQLSQRVPPAVRYSDAERQVAFCVPDSTEGCQPFAFPGVRLAQFADGAAEQLWWCSCSTEMLSRQQAINGLDFPSLSAASFTTGTQRHCWHVQLTKASGVMTHLAVGVTLAWASKRVQQQRAVQDTCISIDIVCDIVDWCMQYLRCLPCCCMRRICWVASPAMSSCASGRTWQSLMTVPSLSRHCRCHTPPGPFLSAAQALIAECSCKSLVASALDRLRLYAREAQHALSRQMLLAELLSTTKCMLTTHLVLSLSGIHGRAKPGRLHARSTRHGGAGEGDWNTAHNAHATATSASAALRLRPAVD